MIFFFFFGFLYSGPLDFNFLKVGPLVTLSYPSLLYVYFSDEWKEPSPSSLPGEPRPYRVRGHLTAASAKDTIETTKHSSRYHISHASPRTFLYLFPTRPFPRRARRRQTAVGLGLRRPSIVGGAAFGHAVRQRYARRAWPLAWPGAHSCIRAARDLSPVSLRARARATSSAFFPLLLRFAPQTVREPFPSYATARQRTRYVANDVPLPRRPSPPEANGLPKFLEKEPEKPRPNTFSKNNGLQQRIDNDSRWPRRFLRS
jgi:hypothetical protein